YRFIFLFSLLPTICAIFIFQTRPRQSPPKTKVLLNFFAPAQEPALCAGWPMHAAAAAVKKLRGRGAEPLTRSALRAAAKRFERNPPKAGS
ncbi:hypothetical protein D7Y41_30190, partial [Anaerotruncus sp. 1XD22-93]